MSPDANHEKQRAPRNRTITLAPHEAEFYRRQVVHDIDGCGLADKVVCADAFKVLQKLPAAKYDLLFADPPYNLTKKFGKEIFSRSSLDEYEDWLDSWLKLCAPLLKSTASIYICGDWRSSSAIERAGTKYFRLRNRITWEREKGRGAQAS